MIGTRYGLSLCTVWVLVTDWLLGNGKAMDMYNEGAPATRSFFHLLAALLRKIESLLLFVERGEIDQKSRDYARDSIDRIRADRRTMELMKPDQLLLNMRYRAMGRHAKFPEFQGREYPSYTDAARDLIHGSIDWSRDIRRALAQFDVDQDATRLQKDLKSLTPPATTSELERIGKEIWREASWAEEISSGMNSQPEGDDGPASPYTWIQDGKRFDGEMNQRAWELINFLWHSDGRRSSYEELAEPVYGDSSRELSGDEIPSLCRKANKFFQKHLIHWHAATTSVGAEPTAYVKRKTRKKKPEQSA